MQPSPRGQELWFCQRDDAGDDSDDTADLGSAQDSEDGDDGESGELWWLVEDGRDVRGKRSICVACGRDLVGEEFQHCYKCWGKWRSYYATLKSRKACHKRTQKSTLQGRRKRDSSDEVSSDGSGPSAPKKSRRSSKSSTVSMSESQSSACSTSSSLSVATSEGEGEAEGDEEEEEKCLVCHERPAEMSLEHVRVMHQCVCGPCSKQLMKMPKKERRCPLCKRRFTSALKVFE